MKLNVRTLTSIVIFITLYTACVVFYVTYRDQLILLKGERKINNRTTLIRRKWSHRKRATLQAMTDDEKDNSIRHLKKRIDFLLRELNSIKNKCKLQEERDDTVADNEDLESSTRLNNGQVIAKADFLTPLQSTNDVAYNMFSAEKLYQVNSIARPSKVFTKESFQRQGKHEHLSRALDEAKIFLKKSVKFTSNVNLTLKTGLFRENANLGVQYEIHLEAKSANRDETYGVTLAQPLSPFILLSPPVKTNLNTLVNIIVPLQGRMLRFEEYLHHFKSVCLQRNENVYLTVVYSGEKGVKNVLKLLNNLREETNFTNFNLLTEKESFNRGQLLHVAATQWNGDENVLMFFCDVDISFEPDFLERCRMFTKPAGSVYFPIVFNYYNPYYVRQETDKLWKISRKTGYWRIHGYGMACHHRQDYFRVGGFDLNISGWGTEDVELHQKYVRQGEIRVIRAPDSGIFHHFHRKECSTTLPKKQYRNCESSRLNTEASKYQYGREVLRLKKMMKSFA